LIIEVTSPKTRVLDLKSKVKQYAQARVPHYVIADAQEGNGRRRLRLICYRLEGEDYKEVPLDEHGRAWLEPMKLWLGVRVHPETGGDRLVLIDPTTNQEIGDYTAVNQARAAAVEQARAATEQARAATERADVEAHTRAQAEAQVRELQAQIRRLQGKKAT
jgi:hypothetical protein